MSSLRVVGLKGSMPGQKSSTCLRWKPGQSTHSDLRPWIRPCQPGTTSRQCISCGWDKTTCTISKLGHVLLRQKSSFNHSFVPMTTLVHLNQTVAEPVAKTDRHFKARYEPLTRAAFVDGVLDCGGGAVRGRVSRILDVGGVLGHRSGSSGQGEDAADTEPIGFVAFKEGQPRHLVITHRQNSS